MYIVHCRVIVDNMCEFQHSSSHVDCNLDARTLEQNAEVSFNKETKKARLPTDSCLNNSERPSSVNCISTSPECRSDHRWLVHNHSLVLIPQVSALSVIARSLTPKFSPSGAISLCSQNFALHVAIALHLALALLLAIAVMIHSS